MEISSMTHLILLWMLVIMMMMMMMTTQVDGAKFQEREALELAPGRIIDKPPSTRIPEGQAPCFSTAEFGQSCGNDATCQSICDPPDSPILSSNACPWQCICCVKIIQDPCVGRICRNGGTCKKMCDSATPSQLVTAARFIPRLCDDDGTCQCCGEEQVTCDGSPCGNGGKCEKICSLDKVTEGPAKPIGKRALGLTFTAEPLTLSCKTGCQCCSEQPVNCDGRCFNGKGICTSILGCASQTQFPSFDECQPDCICCVPCGGDCGSGGTCRSFSCEVNEEKIDGECRFNCVCCRRISAPTTPAATTPAPTTAPPTIPAPTTPAATTPAPTTPAPTTPAPTTPAPTTPEDSETEWSEDSEEEDSAEHEEHEDSENTEHKDSEHHEHEDSEYGEHSLCSESGNCNHKIHFKAQMNMEIEFGN